MFTNTTRQEAPKKPSSAEIARNLQVGVMLHDNSTTMKEGWAIVPGKHPWRARGLYDLPNDTLWVSSGDFKDFRRMGGAQYHHVRRTGYLGMRLRDVARDLGIRIDGGYAEEGGPQLVGFVQDAVRLAVEVYNLDNPLRQLQENTLVETMSKAMPAAPKSPPTLTNLFGSAYQSWSSRLLHFMDNTVMVRLGFARVAYADWLLSNPVPDSAWSHVFSNQGFDHERLMRGEFVPALIEGVIEFDQLDPEIAQLIAFGVGGQTNQRMKRSWMTDVEYRWISDFARVHVVSYYMAKSYVGLPLSHRLPEAFVTDPYQSLSFKTGLVSYMHWQAMVSSKYSMIERRSEYDVYGTWIRAYDRARCFQAAFVLQQQGFHVSGYGNGSVVVQVERERLGELAQIARELDMEYPIWHGLVKEFGYAIDYDDSAD
jgi:hypothetical protein